MTTVLHPPSGDRGGTMSFEARILRNTELSLASARGAARLVTPGVVCIDR